MKRLLLLTVFWAFLLTAAFAREISIQSPDGRIEVRVNTNRELTYSIFLQKDELLRRSVIDLELNDGNRLSTGLAIASARRNQVRSAINSPVPEKRRTIPDRYNQLEIRFRQPYSLIFRVYDDGVAYRIITHFQDSIVIKNEVAHFNFAQTGKAWYPQVKPREDADPFHTSFEEEYTIQVLDSIAPSSLIFNPVLIETGSQTKILLTESDLADYPGMFLTGTSGKGSAAVLPLIRWKKKW